ncbi:hypothetical protein [Nonomuraea diastatica]|uniref:hypothetical protein n=1 Tax=Nonomuraea diastatica TaxID=1848329 RepID=UPI001FE86B0C|nr:hypothetical protein [Nonomuraea diastatica]
MLAAGEAMARAFPGVPLFERARVEIARLVEHLADDVAARRHPRTQIAAALVRLATGRAPAFTLGAGGETALTRVRRMLNPEAPLGRRERLTGLLTVAVLLGGLDQPQPSRRDNESRLRAQAVALPELLPGSSCRGHEDR